MASPTHTPIFDKPYTGKKKQIAELLHTRFGLANMFIKTEGRGSLFYTVSVGLNPVPVKHREAEAAIRELFKDDPKFVGIDV